MNFKNIVDWCRCCLSRNEVIVNLDSGEYREIYEDFLGIKINHLKKSTNGLCRICLHRLKMASKFKKRSLENEKYLERFLHSGHKFDQLSSKIGVNFSNLIISTVLLVSIEPTRNTDENVEEGFTVWTIKPLINTQNTKRISISEECFEVHNSFVSNDSTGEKCKLSDCDKKSSIFQAEIDRSSGLLDYVSDDCDNILPNNVSENTALDKMDDNNTFSNRGVKEDETHCDHDQSLKTVAIKQAIRKIKLNKRSGRMLKKKMRRKAGLSTCSSNIARVVKLSESEVFQELDKIRKSLDFRDKPYKCLACVIVFNSQLMYNNHNEKLHFKKSGTFSCHICSSNFVENSTYRRHLAKHYQKYVCVTCGKRLSDWHVAKIHYERYHDTKKEQFCKICMKTFRNKRVLLDHLKLHDSNKCFACVHCPRVYSAKSLLIDHLCSHTGVKMHKCPFCDKSFSRRSAMVMHSILHDDKARKRYTCEECGLSYATQGKLNEHLKIGARHLKPERLKYACDQCESRFLYASELKTHTLQKHSDKPEKKFVCDLCGRSFAALRTLNNHREKNHNMDGIIVEANKEPALRRYKCKGCLKIFYSDNELIMHKQDCQIASVQKRNDKQDDGKKPQKMWLCSVCCKSLTTKAGLRMHMHCHSGDRPFVCVECGCRFTQPGNLKRHFKVRHGALKQNDRELHGTHSGTSTI